MSDLRISSTAAGYMELDSAHKDADCHIVNVDGGIATTRGCCNLYKPIDDADEFRCGECRYSDIRLASIIALRHGETPGNVKETPIFRGRIDYDLDSEGERMAKAAGEWLLHNANIRAIVSSPMTRTKETCGIVAHILGISDVHIDKDLLPWKPGALQAKPRNAENKKIVDYLTENPTLTVGDSEPMQDFWDRIDGVGDRYSKQGSPEGQILLGAHSSVIGELAARLTGTKHIRPGDTEIVPPGGMVAMFKVRGEFHTNPVGPEKDE
jgi:broad specificity phosphatase PhoE